MFEYSLGRCFTPLTCDELPHQGRKITAYLEYFAAVWSVETIMQTFFLLQFPPFPTPFLKYFFYREGNWYSFQLRTESKSYCSSPPSGSCWPICDSNTRKSYHALQTMYEISIGIWIPQSEDRRKIDITYSTLLILYQSDFGRYRINQQKCSCCPYSWCNILPPPKKEDPKKSYIMIPKMYYYSSSLIHIVA